MRRRLHSEFRRHLQAASRAAATARRGLPAATDGLDPALDAVVGLRNLVDAADHSLARALRCTRSPLRGHGGELTVVGNVVMLGGVVAAGLGLGGLVALWRPVTFPWQLLAAVLAMLLAGLPGYRTATQPRRWPVGQPDARPGPPTEQALGGLLDQARQHAGAAALAYLRLRPGPPTLPDRARWRWAAHTARVPALISRADDALCGAASFLAQLPQPTDTR